MTIVDILVALIGIVIAVVGTVIGDKFIKG